MATKLEKIAKAAEKELDFQWAQDIKKRDGWRCIICQKTGIEHAHHLIPREHRPTRHQLWNGITLCPLHHKFSLEISPHRNAVVFFFWLQLFRQEQFKKVHDYLKAKDELIWSPNIL